jgi:ABC-type sugar transport system ATPase subunit
MGSVPLLSARGIAKSFGGRHVLDGLDLELAGAAHAYEGGWSANLARV